MRKYYIYMTLLSILSFWRCNIDVSSPAEPEYQIIKGFVRYNSVPIEGAEVGFVLDNDTTHIVYTNSEGNFIVQLNKGRTYSTFVYSSKYLDQWLTIDTNIDTVLTVNLERIDYYPSKAGTHWKYLYIMYHDPFSYNITVERTIISSTDSTIISMIKYSGSGYERGYTVTIDETFEFTEQKNDDGHYNSFIGVLPGALMGGLDEFKIAGKYLHPYPRSITTNPQELVHCALIPEYESYQNLMKFEKDNSYGGYISVHSVKTAFIANYIGYTSIDFNYQTDMTRFNYSLKLIDFD